jgi:hypothetical protein
MKGRVGNVVYEMVVAVFPGVALSIAGIQEHRARVSAF